MEDNRRKPSQPENETDFTEVILEPIQDIGLPKKRTNGSSLSRKRKKRRRQRQMIIGLGVVIALVLSVFVYMFISNQRAAAAEAAAQIAAEEAARAQQEKDRQEFEALANATTFLEGITVNGIDIGGMTMDEIPYWRKGTLEKYEPWGDYVVVKFARWAFEKFKGSGIAFKTAGNYNPDGIIQEFDKLWLPKAPQIAELRKAGATL